VRDVLARCLAADRAKRPRMAEVRSTLERELLIAQSGRFAIFISHCERRVAGRACARSHTCAISRHRKPFARPIARSLARLPARSLARLP